MAGILILAESVQQCLPGMATGMKAAVLIFDWLPCSEVAINKEGCIFTMQPVKDGGHISLSFDRAKC